MVGLKNVSLLDVVIMSLALGCFYWGTFYYAWNRTVAMLIVGVGLLLMYEFLRRWSAKEQSLISYTWVSLVVIATLGLIVRWLLIDIVSYDMITFFIPWYDYIVAKGGWSALGSKVGGYSPFYSYFLALATYLPVSKVVAIKTLPILFDFVLAIFIYRIVKLKYGSAPLIPIMAFAAVVFLPTLVFNSGDYGQFDSVYIALIFGSLYYALLIVDKKHGLQKVSWDKLLAISFLGLAVSVKLHAVLFLIPLMVLYVSRYIERRFFVLVPLIYLLIIAPSMALGLPLADAINYRTVEVNYFRELASGAPTVYQLLPYYPTNPFQVIGIFSAAILVVMMALLMSKHEFITKDSLIRVTIVALLVVPFILPAMRERYFLPAEIAAIVYAFYFPKRWWVPVVLSTVMLLISNRLISLPDEVFFKWYHLSLVVGFLVVVVLKDFFINEVIEEKQLILRR